MKIRGKIIVITGASSGIGKSLKSRFEKENTVVSVSRSANFPDIACDLSDAEQVERAAEQIKQRFGRVDVLINNAGYGLYGAAELLGEEETEKQFAVNLTGAVNFTRLMLPLMQEGGRIINISSACALFPLPFRTMYCASKAGLLMFSHGLKMELEPYGIQVTAVCPGDIKTPFTVHRVKNYATNARYGDRISRADAVISSREDKRMPESYAVNKIYGIIAKRRYKPMYIVGMKYKLLYFMYRIVPHGWFFAATRRLFS